MSFDKNKQLKDALQSIESVKKSGGNFVVLAETLVPETKAHLRKHGYEVEKETCYNDTYYVVRWEA